MTHVTLFSLDSLILILSAITLFRVYMHIFTAHMYMELRLKRLYLFKRAFALIISQNDYKILFVTSSNGWWHDTTPQRGLSQPLIVELNLLIVFKSSTGMITAKYWNINIVYFFRSHNKNMRKNCFFNFAFLYFVLKNCEFYVTMKKETIRNN